MAERLIDLVSEEVRRAFFDPLLSEGSGEVITTRPPGVSFRRSDVQPPAQFYVYPTAQLFCSIDTSLTSVIVQVSGLFLDPDGHTREFNEIFTTGSASAPETFTRGFKEGFLLSLNVRTQTSDAVFGSLFVQAGFAFGGAPNELPVNILVGGYVTPQRFLSWPGSGVRASTEGPGKLVRIDGANPTAGNEWRIEVPAGRRWRIASIIFTLVTDATAATRQVKLRFDNGVDNMLFIPCEITQTASLTREYTACALGAPALSSGEKICFPIPSNILMFQGWEIHSATENLQAGDNFGSADVMVEEWLDRDQ